MAGHLSVRLTDWVVENVTHGMFDCSGDWFIQQVTALPMDRLAC
jgi:hypothetical protein